MATEAGRPWRGPRVLARVRTSWMSRELWLGGAFTLVAIGGWRVEGPPLSVLGAAAAVALVLGTGLGILLIRRARRHSDPLEGRTTLRLAEPARP